MDAIVWTILVMTTLAGIGLGSAFSLYGLWRDAQRERDIFVELHALASRDLQALMAGAPVHLVNVCRDCQRPMRLVR